MTRYFPFSACELGVVEIVIKSAAGKQLFVRALFDDVAVVEHEDEVGVPRPE